MENVSLEMTFKMNVFYLLQYIYTCFHDLKGLHIRGKITEEQLTGTGLKRVNDFQIKKYCFYLISHIFLTSYDVLECSIKMLTRDAVQ